MPHGNTQRNHMDHRKKPFRRSKLRTRLGKDYYGLQRRFFWIGWRRKFASETADPLPCRQFAHQTPLLRQLNQVDMRYQYNKIINLRIAVLKLNGLVIHPGEVFSYWYLVGKPTKRKGYVDGMILVGGKPSYGVGGGLCQLSNLIYWMTLHTPLTVVERHRHGYDVFPDADRTQPFGSGATCSYPHIDLMIQNNTDRDFQLLLHVGETHLEGEWRAETPNMLRYDISELNHKITAEYWGGYTRSNELVRQTWNQQGDLIDEETIAKNDAVMMYEPFIEQLS